MEIKDRIQEFIDSKGLEIKAFEKEIGVSNGSWKGAGSLSENVLLKVIGRWPELSSSWLLTGKGNMFADDNLISPNDSEELIRLRNENERLREELRRHKDPEQPRKESEVYLLWMEHMRITEKMQELYQKEKEG